MQCIDKNQLRTFAGKIFRAVLKVVNTLSGKQVREIKAALDFLSGGLLPAPPGKNDGYDLAVYFAGHIATLLDLEFADPRSVFRKIAERKRTMGKLHD